MPKLIKKVIDFSRQLIFGRDKLDRISQKKLTKFGKRKIVELFIARESILKSIKLIADVATLGQLNSAMQKHNYDKIFHLQARVLLDNGVWLKIEKNETVSISRSKKLPKKVEQHYIEVRGRITLQRAFDNVRHSYTSDKQFYSYNSMTNNCQQFVRKLLTSNSSFRETKCDLEFIEQDTRAIFKNFPHIGPIARILTEIGHRAGIILTGGESKKTLKTFMQKSLKKMIHKDLTMKKKKELVMLAWGYM